MGKIFEKDSFSKLSPHESEYIKPEGKIPQGSEFALFKVNVHVHRKGKIRVSENRMLQKIPKLRGGGNLPWREALEILQAQNKEAIRDTFEKFSFLKSVNQQQPKGAHRFNIPRTIRVEKNNRGLYSLLITDVSDQGRNKIIDLGEPKGYTFDKSTADQIAKHVKRDMDLAEKYAICLSTANHKPILDTWHAIVRPSGETTVMILDMGKYTKLYAEENMIHESQMKVQSALMEFQGLLPPSVRDITNLK